MGRVFLYLVLAYSFWSYAMAARIDPNLLHAGLRRDQGLGALPLYFDGRVAGDLSYRGKALHPQEALDLWRKAEIADLSELQPLSSELNLGDKVIQDWADRYPLGPAPQISLAYTRLQFQSAEGQMYGVYQFVARANSGELLQVGFGPRASNRLLTRSLLYKLGYFVTPYRYQKTIEIAFASSVDKKEFLAQIYQNSLLSDSQNLSPGGEDTGVETAIQHNSQNPFLEILRYDFDSMSDDAPEKQRLQNKFRDLLGEFSAAITDSMFDNGTILEIEDVFLAEPAQYFIDPASPVSRQTMQGKRKYGALVAAYALTDLPGSLNLFGWEIGKVVHGVLEWDYIGRLSYDPSFADVKWLAHRIARLGEEDWRQIAREAKLCDCAEDLLFEILKSRRNSLVRLLSISASPLPVQTQLQCSGGVRVERGVLQDRFCPGSRRALTADRYSGLGLGEGVWSLLQSISYSNLLQNALAQLNQKMPQTDLGSDVISYRIDQSAKQFAEFLATGNLRRMEFARKSFPFYRSQLLYNRDLVVGPIFGTENNIQLVENLGLQLNVGKFHYFSGLGPSENLFGNTDVSLLWNLTHIRPIQIEQKSLESEQSELPTAIAQAVTAQVSSLFSLLALPLEAFPRLPHNAEKQPLDPWWSLSARARAYAQSLESLDDENLIQGFRSLLAAYRQLGEDRERRRSLNQEFYQAFDLLIKRHPDFPKLWAQRWQELTPEDPAMLNPDPAIWSTDLARELSALATTEASLRNTSWSQVLEDFFTAFGVGDSLLAQARYQVGAQVNGELLLASNTSYYLDLYAQAQALYRTHVHRLDKYRVQIYRSLADSSVIGFLTGLRLYFRFLSIGQEFSLADVETRQYVLDLSTQLTAAPDSQERYELALSKLLALRELFFTGSLQRIKKLAPPVRVQHNTSEHRQRFRLLFWRNDALRTEQHLQIQDTEGEATKLYRYNESQRSGRDLQNFVIDLGNAYLREHVDTDLQLSVTGNDDPGTGFFGFSELREGQMEAVVDVASPYLQRRCLSIRYRHSQMIVSPRSYQEILKTFRRKFGIDFFTDNSGHRFEHLERFQFQAELQFYEPALRHLEQLSAQNFSQILQKYLVFPQRYPLHRERQQEFEKRLHQNLWRRFRQLKSVQESDSTEAIAKAVARLLLYAESYLLPGGLLELVGGLENVYFTARTDAYRKGDESLEPSLRFDSFGRRPGASYICPLQAVQARYQFLPAELLLYWLNVRL